MKKSQNSEVGNELMFMNTEDYHEGTKVFNREEDSVFVRHERCRSCGSKDNLARYNDGHGYCFGCHYRDNGDDSDTDKDNDSETC